MKKPLSLTALLMITASVTFAQVDSTLVDDCLTCLPSVAEKNWPAAITCAVTAAVAAVIRYFEKRKMKKNSKN